MAKQRDRQQQEIIEPTHSDDRILEALERIERLEQENANLRANIRPSAMGNAVEIPDGARIQTKAARVQVLPDLEPTKDDHIVRYASASSIDRRIREGWELHPDAKQVGDAIPIQIAKNNELLAARKAAKEQRESAHEQQLRTEARRGDLPVMPGASTFTEYQRTRG